MSREDQAKIEIGRTSVSKVVTYVLCSSFLAAVFFVPVSQGIHELRNYLTGGEKTFLPSFLTVYSLAGDAAQRLFTGRRDVVAGIVDANEHLRAGIDAYEDDLENDSLFRKAVLPPAQSMFAGLLGLGNEKVIVGKDGWLFYEPGVAYLTSHTSDDFLPAVDHSAKANTLLAQKKTSPLRAVLDFKRQLAARNILLVLLPVPVKPMFYAGELSASFDDSGAYLQNPHFARFKRDLEKEGVPVLDPSDAMLALKKDSPRPIFFKADSHWRPEAMAAAAKFVAESLEARVPLSARHPVPPPTAETRVENTGDLAAILFLDKRAAARHAERAAIRRIGAHGGGPWAPDEHAEILFLGDSFANIFSLGGMGWGESAGLVEHLSFFLGRPVDRICLNDNGAYATRRALQRELSRGRDRLAGKKVVVWEFAVRELVAGDWQLVEMKLGEKAAAAFFAPAPGREAIVSGVVDALSERPVPGKTPYKDHVMSLRLADAAVDGAPAENVEVLVYIMSMRDNRLTAAAGFQTGQTVVLRVKNWYDVSETYGSLNRSELDDDDLLTADPCWGEEIVK